MKKKPEKIRKTGEFSSTPFAALKGVQALPLPSLPVPVKPVIPPAVVPDDGDIFLRAMADVQRIHGNRMPKDSAPRSEPKPMVRRIDGDEQKLFLEALAGLKLEKVFQDEPEDELVPARERRNSRLRQLRRGTVRVDYELDLQGLSREETLEALEAFIGGAYRRGQQALLVMIGEGEDIGRGQVEEWLRNNGAGMVEEFMAAPPEFGGGGALLVFLKIKSP